jgi:hypothetical protein
MASKSIGVRIPDAINERFESYGRRHFPKGDGFDKTKTALDLICKGLQCSPDQENDVEQIVKQIVEQEMRTVIEEVTATVAGLNGEIETLKRLIDQEDTEEDSGMSRSTLAPIFEDF